MPPKKPRAKPTQSPATPRPSTAAAEPQPSTSRDTTEKNKRKQKKPQKRDTMSVYHVGTKTFYVSQAVLMDIKRLQMSTHTLIPKLPFARVVKEILMSYNRGSQLRVQLLAMEALQTATEIFLTNLFADSYLLTLHAKRGTLMVPDLVLANKLRNE